MTAVEIVFPDIATATAFILWMSKHGEQEYFIFTKSVDLPRVDDFQYSYDHKRIIGTFKEE